MSDSRRFETELHEGDLVFTVRRASDLLFSKEAVEELEEEVVAFVECAVSRSEAVAINSPSSVVNSQHVVRNVQFEGDSLSDRLRGLVYTVGGGLFVAGIIAMREMRTVSVESMQFAVTCGFVGLTMLMIGFFGWSSVLRSWGTWRRKGRRVAGAALRRRSVHRAWWSREG